MVYRSVVLLIFFRNKSSSVILVWRLLRACLKRTRRQLTVDRKNVHAFNVYKVVLLSWKFTINQIKLIVNINGIKQKLKIWKKKHLVFDHVLSIYVHTQVSVRVKQFCRRVFKSILPTLWTPVDSMSMHFITDSTFSNRGRNKTETPYKYPTV